MNALDQVRLRSGSPYVPSGVAPDSGGIVGNQGVSVSGNVGLDGSVQTTGVLILVLLGVIVAIHVMAK